MVTAMDAGLWKRASRTAAAGAMHPPVDALLFVWIPSAAKRAEVLSRGWAERVGWNRGLCRGLCGSVQRSGEGSSKDYVEI